MPRHLLIVEDRRQPLVIADGDTPENPCWDEVTRVDWTELRLEQIDSRREDILIANAAFPCARAEAFFDWLKTHRMRIPVVAVLPPEGGALVHAAEAADDFLYWPVRACEFERRIARFCSRPHAPIDQVEKKLISEIGLGMMIGQSPAFLKAVEQIALFGTSNIPILFTGETGTGKELSARVAHLLSQRSTGPFIPVDCGALPDHLFENEVFGHVRGAYTDARADQKGLVALAEGGTLFLDEIDSLSPAAQSKVLRLLQEHTYRPLGSERFKRADVRILVATNRNLQQLVNEKLFRADLFFRVNVLRVRLPALRERRSDIALLCRHFLDEISATTGGERKTLSPASLHKLEAYDWPGNLRELYNTMQQAALCSPGPQIAASAVVFEAGPGTHWGEPETDELDSFRSAKQRAIDHFERDYVRQMMAKHAGNVTQAAREAGKDRRAFGRLAKKYQITSTAL
jgi:DNA-binding NtrC family response regulator